MASLSDRLRTAQPNRQNRGGCVTCLWWEQIKPDTRRLINEWLDNKHSVKQLYEILSAPTSDDEPALPISMTGFRLHLNHHDTKCRDGD